MFIEEWKKSTSGTGQVFVRAYVRTWPDGRVALAAVEIKRSNNDTIVMSWEKRWQGPGERESLAEMGWEDGSVVTEHLWHSETSSATEDTETVGEEDDFFGTDEETEGGSAVPAKLEPYRGNELLTADEVLQRAGSVGRYFFIQDRRDGSYIGDSEARILRLLEADPKLRKNAALIYAVSRENSTANLVLDIQPEVPHVLDLFQKTKEPITILVRGGQQFHFHKNQRLFPKLTFTLTEFPMDIERSTFGTGSGTGAGAPTRWAVVSAKIDGNKRYAVVSATNSRIISSMIPASTKVTLEAMFDTGARDRSYSVIVQETLAAHGHLRELEKVRILGAKGLDATVIPNTERIVVAETGQRVLDSHLEDAEVRELFDVVADIGQPHVVVRAADGRMRLLPVELLRLANPDDYEVLLVLPDYAGAQDNDDALTAMEEQADRVILLSQVPLGSKATVKVLTPAGFDNLEQEFERPGTFVDPSQTYQGKERLTQDQVRALAGNKGTYYFVRDVRTDSYIGDKGEKFKTRLRRDPGLRDNSELVYAVVGNDNVNFIRLASIIAEGVVDSFANTKAPIHVLSRGKNEYFFNELGQLIPELTFLWSEFPGVSTLANPGRSALLRSAVLSAKTPSGQRRYTVVGLSEISSFQKELAGEADLRVEAITNFAVRGRPHSETISDLVRQHSHLLRFPKIRVIGDQGLDATIITASIRMAVAESGQQVQESDLRDDVVRALLDVAMNFEVHYVVVRASGQLRMMPLEQLRLADAADYEVVLVVPNYSDVQSEDEVKQMTEALADRVVSLQEIPVGTTLRVPVLTPEGFANVRETLDMPGKFVKLSSIEEGSEQGTNNFLVEVGNASLTKQTVTTVERNAQGAWSRQPIQDLQGAYEDPQLIREQLTELVGAGTAEDTVDAIDLLVGTSAVPFQLEFRSGFRELGESKLEGKTVVAGIDAQAAQSPGLLALILYHEKIGHGLGQYWNANSLPQALGAELTALRDELEQQGDLEVFSEVLAQMLSTDLFVNGFSDVTKDEVYRFLSSGENSVDFGGKAFDYLKAVDKAGQPLTKAQLLGQTAKFVMQSYFQDHPNKAHMEAVLTQMQEQPQLWLERIERAEAILQKIVRNSVKVRGSPLHAAMEQALRSDNLAAQAILRYTLEQSEGAASNKVGKALDKLQAAKPKPQPANVDVGKISSSRESLLERAKAAGQMMVELEVYEDSNAVSYVVGTMGNIEGYLREQRMTDVSQYRIRLVTSFYRERKLPVLKRVLAIWPQGQRFLTVASEKFATFSVDRNRKYDPVETGFVHAGFEDHKERGKLLWRHAQELGGSAVLLLVQAAGSQGPYLSIVKLREIPLIDRSYYSLTPIALTPTGNINSPINTQASAHTRVLDLLTGYELFDSATAGVDVYFNRDQHVRYGKDAQPIVPSAQIVTIDSTTVPTRQQFAAEAKQRLANLPISRGLLLLISDTESLWVPSGVLFSIREKQFAKAFLYSSSLNYAAQVAKDLLIDYDIHIATNVIEVVTEKEQQLFLGKEGVSFENGERVLVRENGLEADPQVLLSEAERYGFQIIQATRKQDEKVVWIAGELNAWLRQHLTETEYEVDLITQNQSLGNLHSVVSFFREVLPGQSVYWVAAKGDGTYRRGLVGAQSQRLVADSIEYNQYGIRITEDATLSPQPMAATGETLSRMWSRVVQAEDIPAVVYRNDFELAVETDVKQAQPARPGIVPIPPNNPNTNQASFADSLVQLVEDGIVSLGSVQVSSIDILKRPATGLIEEIVVGLRGTGVHAGRRGTLGIRWQGGSAVDVDKFNTTEKARAFFAGIPAERILYAGTEKLGPAELYSLLGGAQATVVEFMLADRVYVVVRVDSQVGPLFGKFLSIPYSVVGGASNKVGHNRKNNLLTSMKGRMKPGNPPVFAVTPGSQHQGSVPIVETFQLMDGALHPVATQELGSEVSAFRDRTVNGTLYEEVPTQEEIIKIAGETGEHLILVYMDDRAGDGRFGFFRNADSERLQIALGGKLQSRLVLQVKSGARSTHEFVPRTWGQQSLVFSANVTPDSTNIHAYSRFPGFGSRFSPVLSIDGCGSEMGKALVLRVLSWPRVESSGANRMLLCT